MSLYLPYTVGLMAAKKENRKLDRSTEEKIKSAARTVFHKKGFAATRTREIAEEAGINLALLNYYFRSKEKLFQIIMLETMQGFYQTMIIVFMDGSTTLEEKIEQVAEKYIDLVVEQPEIPLFILSEIRNSSGDFFTKLPINELLKKSSFMQQFQEAVQQKKVADVHPIHFVLNLMGLIVFPFIARPVLTHLGEMADAQFRTVMEERKKLIPVWMKTIMAP